MVRTKLHLIQFSQGLFQCLGQLVGAGGGLEAAAYAFQTLDDFFDRHPFHQPANALRVAIAAVFEFNVFQNAVFNFKIDGLAACASIYMSEFHLFSF